MILKDHVTLKTGVYFLCNFLDESGFYCTSIFIVLYKRWQRKDKIYDWELGSSEYMS